MGNDAKWEQILKDFLEGPTHCRRGSTLVFRGANGLRYLVFYVRTCSNIWIKDGSRICWVVFPQVRVPFTQSFRLELLKRFSRLSLGCQDGLFIGVLGCFCRRSLMLDHLNGLKPIIPYHSGPALAQANLKRLWLKVVGCFWSRKLHVIIHLQSDTQISFCISTLI